MFVICTFPSSPLLSRDGFLNMRIEVTKRAARETVQNRSADTFTAYQMLEQSKKLCYLRVGFGWIYLSQKKKNIHSWCQALPSCSTGQDRLHQFERYLTAKLTQGLSRSFTSHSIRVPRKSTRAEEIVEISIADAAKRSLHGYSSPYSLVGLGFSGTTHPGRLRNAGESCRSCLCVPVLLTAALTSSTNM
jgi:hypothetical protein